MDKIAREYRRILTIPWGRQIFPKTGIFYKNCNYIEEKVWYIELFQNLRTSCHYRHHEESVKAKHWAGDI